MFRNIPILHFVHKLLIAQRREKYHLLLYHARNQAVSPRSLKPAQFRASIPFMFTIFRGGRSGAWRVTRFASVKGASLAPTPSVSVVHSLSITLPIMPSPTAWRLAGVASHLRYTERAEKTELDAVRAEIGRPEATYAA